MINYNILRKQFRGVYLAALLSTILLGGLSGCDSRALPTQAPQAVTLMVPTITRMPTIAPSETVIPIVNTPPMIPPTLTATYTCPLPTEENLQIQPVQSPTSELAQQIQLTVGNLDSVTISNAAGTFQFNQPPYIIPLVPNTINTLTVSVTIKRVLIGGCTYGGYSMVRTLTIVQKSASPTLANPISPVF